MTFDELLHAMTGDDLVDRAIEAASCNCGGKCLCHHPNPVVGIAVKEKGECICGGRDGKG